MEKRKKRSKRREEEMWDRAMQRKDRRERCDMINLYNVIWVIDITKSIPHVQSMLDCKQKEEKFVRL